MKVKRSNLGHSTSRPPILIFAALLKATLMKWSLKMTEIEVLWPSAEILTMRTVLQSLQDNLSVT